MKQTDSTDRSCNILFLGGAKRVSMARRFIDAAHRFGIEQRIFSYELSEEVPVALVATVIVGRRWRDPQLMEHLADVVIANNIRIIIPFVDDAVGIAARFRDKYPQLGVWVPTGSDSTAEAMFDKTVADTMLREAGIPLPQRITDVSPDTHFPIIAKPRHGSASKGILVCRSWKEWTEVAIDPERYLIQPYFADRREYTVDCYVRLDGAVQAVSPRLRIDVLGGEVSDTMTIDDQELTDIARKVLGALPLRGAVTIQILRSFGGDGTHTDYLMEINPRLGGGAVCSVDAGCDIPLQILADAFGHDVAPSVAKPRVRMVRFMQECVFSDSSYQI